ncbi:universal stress protein [Novipirellula artificiosorum]|uniref:Universal stress protein G n=1 Tax=Novipirellula artificiosorum TaxID=2528016 RepID=A0A5C6D8R2_9BACT|nr:universal stress protein [Novipirellula artificiosorum]TWU31586.1 Universal stress protein G [Novipirellula artificiosorum]
MSGLHPKKTIVPIDFSDLSYGALEKALEIAGVENTVEVIHVLPPMLVMEPSDLYGSVSDSHRKESTIKRLKEKLSDEKYQKVRIRVAVGDAGHEIVACAKRESADLIVMPSHGYGFLKHVWLGSVAERVVRTAPCPVLVLRS